MRHSKLVLLSTLSLLAILTASQSWAASSADLGFLKPRGKWEVGTVKADEGQSYCAMVNKFDRDAVLAFSRTAEGEGSIAIDFHQNLFTPGVQYDVGLKVDDAKKRKFSARASSSRSVVVDVGQDERFYDALNEDGNLQVTMQGVEAIFALRKFSQSYVPLLDCAGGLAKGPKTEAVPVPRVEKLALADDGGEAAKQREENNDKISELSKLQRVLIDQLEQQKQKVVELETKRSEQQQAQEELKLAVESKDREIAQLEAAQKQQAGQRPEDISQRERALALRLSELQKERNAMQAQMEASRGSAGKGTDLSEALNQQKQKTYELSRALSEAQADYQAKLAAAEAERAELKAKLASVMTEKTPPGKDKVETELVLTKASLAAKIENVARLESRIAEVIAERRAANDAAVEAQADLAEKQAQLAEMVRQQTEKSGEVSRKLSDAQSAYKAQLLAAQAARDELKKRSDAEMASVKSKLSDLEVQLALAAQQKEELTHRLQEQAGQKRESVAYSKAIADLQAQLREKTAQYELLERQYDERSKALPATDKLAGALVAKMETVARLEKQLAEVESQRQAVTDVAAKAQAELAEKQAQLAEMTKQQMQKSETLVQSLSGVHSDYQSQLAAAQAERDTLKKKLDAAIAENGPLKSGKNKAEAELVSVKAKLADLESLVTSAAMQKQSLATQMEEQDKKTKALQAMLAAREYKQSSLAEDAKRLEAVEAQLAEKTAQYEGLQQKLSGMEGERQATAQELAQKLTAAQVERDTLKQKLSAITAENTPLLSDKNKAETDLALTRVKLTELEDKLTMAGHQRQQLAMRLDAQSKQTKILRAALDAKEQELSSTKTASAAAQSELESLKPEYASVVRGLMGQLKDKTAQYDGLQKRLAAAQAKEALLVADKEPVAVKKADKAPVKKEQIVDISVPMAAKEAVKVNHVADLEPAAGGTAPVPQVQEVAEADMPVQEASSSDEGLSHAEAFLNKIMEQHRPKKSQAPVAAKKPETPKLKLKETGVSETARVVPGAVTLEGLLNSTGIAINNFIPVEQNEESVISQWTSGKISGMYEQTAAEGDLESQVNAYLERYREDCPEKLSAHVLPPEIGGAGTTVVADIECAMPSNSYTSAFLFLQDDSGFSTILHTAYASGKAEVRRIRDIIADALKNSPGFHAPQIIKQSVSKTAPLRFNIPAVPVEAAPSGIMDNPEPILIQ